MSKNIVEMINALNTQHKYAIADAVHNVDIPEEPDEDKWGYYEPNWEIMSAGEFQDYLINDLGWQKGTYEREVDGVTYTFGAENTFPIYTFPYENLSSKIKYIKVVYKEGETGLYTGIAYDERIENGKVQKNVYTSFSPGKYFPTYVAFSKSGMSVKQEGMLFIPQSSFPLVCMDFYGRQNTTHSRFDLNYRIFIDAKGILIRNGHNFTQPSTASKKLLPQITLGSTTLDEAKLQALLALINQ